jgi:hypothetical protein
MEPSQQAHRNFQRHVDRLCFLIVACDSSDREIDIKRLHLRVQATALFPEKMPIGRHGRAALRFEEGQQVGVNGIGLGRGHAVRKALVGFQTGAVRLRLGHVRGSNPRSRNVYCSLPAFRPTPLRTERR